MANRLEFYADLNAAGFARGLTQMQAMAAASTARLEKTLIGFTPGTAAGDIAAAARIEFAERATAHGVAMSVEVAQTAKAIATELAMRRAQRVAEVEQFVMSRVPGLAIGGHGFGAGGGPGGGISGIMRETLVIFRELGRGN